jgi:hypothetical protein
MRICAQPSPRRGIEGARAGGKLDCRERIAFAGAGLAVDDRQALRAGRVPERARLLAGDAVEFVAADDLHAGPVVDLKPAARHQALGRAHHVKG